MYQEVVTEQAQSYTLPPPVGGWNARDPLDAMAETDAIGLVNMFPDTGVVRLRRGFREHADGMGSDPVETVAEFSAADGTKYLVAAANGNIYDASTLSASATSLGSGFTSDKWQYVNFRATGSNYIVLVNGVDQPKKWDGSTFNDATYTHVDLAGDEDLVHIWAYKTRIYLVEVDSCNFYYTATGAVTGATDKYDLSSIFVRGGYLQWVSSWSLNSGGGPAEYFVACSSNGEILVYSGSDPDDSAWSLVGRYFVPKPLGRRSFFHIDADLCVITNRGVIPLSRVIGSSDSAQAYQGISDKIQRAFIDAGIQAGSNFGWQGLVFPAGPYALLNIPLVEGGRTEQYVMNLINGSWAQFTGQNASSWAIFNDKIYFGGMDGKVYQANYGYDDNGADIAMYIKPAFSYFGDRSRKKRLLMARPILTGSPSLSFLIGADVDFQERSLTGTASTSGATGSEWNTSPWNTTSWSQGDEVNSNDWYGIAGIGRCASLRLEGDFSGVTFALNATQILFEPGGVI